MERDVDGRVDELVEDDCWRMDGANVNASADGRTPIARKVATSIHVRAVVNVHWCLLMVLVRIVIELVSAWCWMRSDGRLVKFGYVQHDNDRRRRGLKFPGEKGI